MRPTQEAKQQSVTNGGREESALGEVTRRLMRLLADQSQAKVPTPEDEPGDLRRWLLIKWKF
jgi:hypothetical protein